MSEVTKRTVHDPVALRLAIKDNDDRIAVLEALAVTDTVGDGTITTAKLDTDVLSADASGRAKMANDFFDAATVLAKFDADSIDNAQLLLAVKDGAFAADTATRALFGSGFVNAGLLGASAVGAAALASNAVETAKIKDANVTTAKLDDDAVTGPKLAAAAFASYVVAAGNGSGARTMTGALVGDKVVACCNLSDATDDLGAADVESVVTIADQLQQLQTNHTGDKWLVLTVRG